MPETNMKRFQLFIGGEFVDSSSGKFFETEYPYTGQAWAEVAEGSAEDVNRAVAAAQAAFTTGAWPRLTATERGALLHKLGSLIESNHEKLARAEMQDNGKTITEVRNQVSSLPALYRYYAGLADKVHGQTIEVNNDKVFTYTTYEPLGVVAAITPWNSPLRLLSLKLAPALAAGNTVVVKPSEFTSTSTLLLMELINAAGFPPGVVNVVTGFGEAVGAPLVAHPLVRKVSFTGGVSGGIKSYVAAASGLKSAVLELGGKSASIVFPDRGSDTARQVANGIFGSTGQTCVAGSRLLVHEDIHDEFVAEVVSHAKSKRMGDPLDETTELAPMATRPQYERVMAYIREAMEQGAHLAYGGNQSTDGGTPGGLFIEPTIFTHVTPEMTIANEEIFGPVLSVIPFHDEEEAVRIANSVCFGLAAGVWTADLRRAHRLARQLQAGTVWINTYRVNAPQMPVGGYKNSGVGRESGDEAIKEYLQMKSVWIDVQ